jgi:hypothetical protein
MRLAPSKLLVAAGFALFCAYPACAEKIAAQANLMANPSAKSHAIAVLTPGVEVAVEGARGAWSLVRVGELLGYVASAKLVPYNPHCDLGYPYSGSSRYFDGLTELRTSEPLGALFGYHIRRPC